MLLGLTMASLLFLSITLLGFEEGWDGLCPIFAGMSLGTFLAVIAILTSS